MNYELCKQLKAVGFPQEMRFGQWACRHGLDMIMETACSCTGDSLFYAPTLSELIEACGDKFGCLVKVNDDWEAYEDGYGAEDGLIFSFTNGITDPIKKGYGETPGIAVACLYLALKGK